MILLILQKLNMLKFKCINIDFNVILDLTKKHPTNYD